MNNQELSVAETFLSFQGEGQTIGKRAYFLRLAGCNLLCGGKGTDKDGKLHDGATWRCDSIEVWLKGKTISFPDLVQKMGGQYFIDNLRAGVHLIITGGEPLLQQERIYEFIKYLSLDLNIAGLIVEVETNGTITPDHHLLSLVRYWNVSPKLANSGELGTRRINSEALETISFGGRNACFKFVASGRADLSEVEDDFIKYIHYQRQIYIMPAADTREQLNEIAAGIAELCLEFGFNYSHRVHISVWDKKTGV